MGSDFWSDSDDPGTFRPAPDGVPLLGHERGNTLPGVHHRSKDAVMTQDEEAPDAGDAISSGRRKAGERVSDYVDPQGGGVGRGKQVLDPATAFVVVLFAGSMVIAALVLAYVAQVHFGTQWVQLVAYVFAAVGVALIWRAVVGLKRG
jgi:hypothetical protein